MVCPEAKVGSRGFFLSFFLNLSVLYIQIHSTFQYSTLYLLVYLITSLVLYGLLKVFFQGYHLQIALRAAFLGSVFALGICVKIFAPAHIQIFGAYMCVMAFFHFSEFMAIAIIQPKQVSSSSFVINHSPQYIVAATSSWIEFFLECYLFPGMKQVYWLSNIGLFICILGEILRKVAMLTAGSSFSHLVQHEKSNDHVLVTHGVYAWFRHPSYVGWFYWSIGTQIALLNPFCVPAYAIASWMFFKSRIYIEEITLLNFFGQSYCDYQQKVWTGIPFIEGYKI